MTTNVVDESAKIVASDSRWSFIVNDPSGQLHAVIYVDDTEFDKIELGSDYSFIFAGSSKLMEEWKIWSRDPGRSVKNYPPVGNGFSLCMLDMATQKVKFEHGQRIAGSDHRFAGTGALPAYQCWSQNKDAIRCIGSAAAVDYLSGGTTRSLDLLTKAHNLNLSTDHREINQLVLKRGFVMYKAKSVPIADALAKNDPFIAQRVTDIAKGNAAAEAPAGQDIVVWADADISRLEKALEESFGKG